MEFVLFCCGKLVAIYILPSNTINLVDPTMHAKHVACIVESGFLVFDGNTGLFISPWNTLENWLMPQLNEDSNDHIFQQDGSPGHYKDVRGYLNRNLPQRWIGRTGKEGDVLMWWPPRSPDLTPCDFFFWGFWRTLCFHSLLISRFSQLYHHCCGAGRLWYADTCVEWDGLSHRCLPYYQRWTHWASVKYVKKLGEFLSRSA